MSTPSRQHQPAFWQTGFRPFFLGAPVWAVISMLIWFGIFRLDWQFPFNGVSPAMWHGHEMLFGYSMAVVAGFLLTAVPNWTNSEPVSGKRLIIVFSVWIATRLSGLFGGESLLLLTALTDLLFFCTLLLFIAIPIVDKKQYKQSGVIIKIVLLGLANLVFYLGAAGLLNNGIHYGLYSGLYLLIALILTIGRRVIPFFIERRLGLTEPLYNSKWIDYGSLLIFIPFWILDVFIQNGQWVGIAAVLLSGLHALRLYFWHNRGIWSDPLLWVLFLSYGLIVLGFALKATVLLGQDYWSYLAFHLFAVGGIGLTTCGMMARVSLGHTGRNIRNPPPLIQLSFCCLLLAAIFRVLLPMFSLEHYPLWISVSQWLWIAGFTIFLLVYVPVLVRPRSDGEIG